MGELVQSLVIRSVAALTKEAALLAVGPRPACQVASAALRNKAFHSLLDGTAMAREDQVVGSGELV